MIMSNKNYAGYTGLVIGFSCYLAIQHSDNVSNNQHSL